MLEASDYPDLVLSGYPDQDASDAWRRFWRVVPTCLRYLEKPSRRAVYIGQVTLVVRPLNAIEWTHAEPNPPGARRL